LSIEERSKLIRKRDRRNEYELNDAGYEIISRINGKKTFHHLLEELSTRYSDTLEHVEVVVTKYLKTLKEEYGLEILYLSEPKESKITVYNVENFYPSVASIELTHKCNLKCLHCYGNYGGNRPTMSCENAKKLFRDLKQLGVKIIELTGGDITMNPQLNEILLEAVSQNFQNVSLLTNGICLSDEVCETIIKHKDNLYIQIDLHSLDDDYLAWFTKATGTKEVIINKIKKLHAAGVEMRIATIVTKRNLHEMETIADYVYDLGIKQYVVSQVINVGRALQNENTDRDLLLDTDELVIEFFETVRRINDKYKDFINLVEGTRYQSLFQNKPNCGCMTSNISITPKGEIKLCSMDTLEYTSKRFGNVFDKNIREIYDEKKDILLELVNLERPRLQSEECKECNLRGFCQGCILRGVIGAKEKGEMCKWYTNKVSKKLKQTLLS